MFLYDFLTIAAIKLRKHDKTDKAWTEERENRRRDVAWVHYPWGWFEIRSMNILLKNYVGNQSNLEKLNLMIQLYQLFYVLERGKVKICRKKGNILIYKNQILDSEKITELLNRA